MKTEAAGLADRFLLTQCRVYDVPVPEGFAVDSASVNDRKSLARAILESVGGTPVAAPAPAPSSNAKRGKKPRGGRSGGKKKRRGGDEEEDDDVDAAGAVPATPEQALVAMVDACTARTDVSEFKEKFEVCRNCGAGPWKCWCRPDGCRVLMPRRRCLCHASESTRMTARHPVRPSVRCGWYVVSI